MRKYVVLILLLFFSLADVSAIDCWNYPQCAGKNAVVIETTFTGVSFTASSFSSAWFARLPEICIDYMLPVGLPFSVGLFFDIPNPNLKHIGTRIGYHINLDVKGLDWYFLYCFDFGFLRNGTLVSHGDTPVDGPLWWDFRTGLRYEFRTFCLYLETGFKFQSINFGIAIRLGGS
jgi:hypothetical protein